MRSISTGDEFELEMCQNNLNSRRSVPPDLVLFVLTTELEEKKEERLYSRSKMEETEQTRERVVDFENRGFGHFCSSLPENFSWT